MNELLVRIEQMNNQIEGITAYELPPPQNRYRELPIIYAYPPAFTERSETEHGIVRTYNVQLDLLTAGRGNDKMTVNGISAALEKTQTLIDAIAAYYNNHRDMSLDDTEELEPEDIAGLDFVLGDILFSCAGAEGAIEGADGQPYIGTTFQLTIQVLIGYGEF